MKKVPKTLDPNYDVNGFRSRPTSTTMKILALHIPAPVEKVVNKLLSSYATPFVFAAIAVHTFLVYHG